MKIVVVYESMFGNTMTVAEAQWPSHLVPSGGGLPGRALSRVDAR
jgi:hypothetical protein